MVRKDDINTNSRVRTAPQPTISLITQKKRKKAFITKSAARERRYSKARAIYERSFAVSG